MTVPNVNCHNKTNWREILAFYISVTLPTFCFFLFIFLKQCLIIGNRLGPELKTVSEGKVYLRHPFELNQTFYIYIEKALMIFFKFTL